MKIRLYCVIIFYNGGEGGLFDQYKGCIIEFRNGSAYPTLRSYSFFIATFQINRSLKLGNVQQCL